MAQTEPQTIALSIRRLLDGAPRIELTAVFPTREAFDVQLPTWRPGRYELGQFAQYVYAMEGQATDGTWNALSKTSLHTWHVPAETEAVRWVFHADYLQCRLHRSCRRCTVHQSGELFFVPPRPPRLGVQHRPRRCAR